MTDPLSIAAGIAGLISLGLQTTDTLVKFYTSYRGRDDHIARTTQRLEALQSAFHALETALQQRKFQPGEKTLIRQIESSVQSCAELIQELEQECAKLTGKSCDSFKQTVKVAGRRVAYPFRESTLKKLEEDAGETRDHLSLALDILQLRDHKKFQDELTEIKSLVELMRTTQISSAIQDWFKAPDALINHNAASAKRHPGTGMWFVKGPVFHNWINQANSFLWLYGFAGCGKSVICSTAIQHAFRQRRDIHIGVAFFYFTFNDESKQDESAMLRALLWQLASQLPDGHSRLQRLHDSYKTGPPPAAVLSEQLRECIQLFHQVYILIDALDESPRGNRRDDVLKSITTVRGWSMPGLHLLVTSRDVLEIHESLGAASDEKVAMKNVSIDQDIANFISETLSSDYKLRTKWQAHRDRIQEALAKRAQGVFRWVECQFEALKRCPRSEHHLEQCLQSLPRSLDETYERMLLSIDEGYYEEARRILTLLCFSSRPLKVSEVLHGIAVDLGEYPCLNRARLLQGVDDLHDLCPGLIDSGHELEENFDSATDFATDSTRPEVTVRIAHFSVQEYLESDRIRQQKANFFAMSSSNAHHEIATICCTYLLEPQISNGLLTPAKLTEFPLAHFAARFWYHHYQFGREKPAQLSTLITEIFKQQRNCFATWVKLHDPVDAPWDLRVNFGRSSNDIAPALYYACFLGLDWIIHELLFAGNAASRRVEDMANGQGKHYGNALQAASVGGHEQVVKLLLDAGADVNAQGGDYRNALQAASVGGHEQVVKLLLDAGADVNAQGGVYRNALQAASVGGHEQVVKLLLDAGAKADANAFQGGYYGNALQAASIGGHEQVVKLLLDAGADVNAQSGDYGNALQAASVGGREQVVKLLLVAGADVNAHGGDYGNALQAASDGGPEQVVKLLLDAGADVNAQGGDYRNALQAASVGGHEQVVKLLLDAGADVNAQSGDYGNALQAASIGGHEQVVKLLLDAGADVNAQGGHFGNALQAASDQGHEQVVKLLLDAGADVASR